MHISLVFPLAVVISIALAAPLESEKRQQAVTIIEQANAPWGLQRISDPDPIPIEVRSKSKEMAFRYRYDQLSGQGVDVYTIDRDSGVNITHPEFGGRAKMLHIDFGDNEDKVNLEGHGTMVAGIVGSTQYGVAKKANIWGMKCRKSTSLCLAKVLLSHQSRRNLPGFAGSVINMSFGSVMEDRYRSTWDFGNLTALVQAGVHIVTSAGNDNKDACRHWPSAANQDPQTQSIISVGASTIADKKAYFSNHGPCVDIYAPGWTITTTADGGSRQVAGTSLAAPAVAGVLATELALNPGLKLDPIGLKRHLLSKGVTLPDLGVLVNTRMADKQ